MKNMGIREKIRLGFLALGLLLFFSGLISFFELSKLSRSTQSMLGASLKNMELSKTMLDAVQDQNTALLQIIVSGRSDRESDSLLHAGREKFEAAISDAKISIRDLQGFDSVYAANISYNETVGAYLRDSLRKENVDWFVDIYKTSYSDLTSSIKNFMVSSQNMMDAKARRLEDNAYRATMPGFIALVIAIVIVLLTGKYLLAIFNNDPQVIEIGYSRLLILFGSYIFSLTYEILSGYLRGFGISLVPAILTLFGVCGVRIVWINTVFPLHHTFRSIMLVYPISLATTAVLIFIALLVYRPSRRFAAAHSEKNPQA